MKNGIEYFPLNTNFFDDDKIALVEVDCGFLGAYVLLRIISKIYNTEGYFCHWSEDERKLFVKRIGGSDFDLEKLDAIVESGLAREFFDRTMYNKYHILTSRGIQKRFFEAVSRRKVQVYAEYMLIPDVREKCPNVDFVSEPERPSSQPQNTASPVEEKAEEAIGQDQQPVRKTAKRKLSDELTILSHFFFSNYLKPEEELDKFIRNNELMHARDGGWSKMSSTTRLAACMEWRQLDSNKNPIKEVRFDKDKKPFLDAWKTLFEQFAYKLNTSEDILRDMLSDKLNWVNRLEYMGKLMHPYQLHASDILIRYLQDNTNVVKPVLSPILNGKNLKYIPISSQENGNNLTSKSH